MQLKRVSQALLLAELLDIITTLGGLSLIPHLWESNPLPALLGGWVPTLVVKVVATLFVVAVLEAVEDWPLLVKIVPVAALLPGIWNLFIIVVEYMVMMV